MSCDTDDFDDDDDDAIISAVPFAVASVQHTR
jgi:hypothetical protein